MTYTEVTYTLGQAYTFKHVSAPSLADVHISIYTSAFAPVALGQLMTELAPGTGVYIFSYTPVVADTYTAIMSSATEMTTSVIDAVFLTPAPPPSGSVTISNSVGVGTKC